MDEKDVEKLFHKYKNILIKKWGRVALYDDQIDKFARENIPKYKGTYSQDRIPKSPGFYIVNTGNHKSPGIHWVALIRTNKYDYVYDSFGRKTGNIVRSLAGSGRVVESDRKDTEQNDADPRERNICGMLSLAFLLVARDVGIRNSLKI